MCAPKPLNVHAFATMFGFSSEAQASPENVVRRGIDGPEAHQIEVQAEG
jgi:hypothetical protein